MLQQVEEGFNNCLTIRLSDNVKLIWYCREEHSISSQKSSLWPLPASCNQYKFISLGSSSSFSWCLFIQLVDGSILMRSTIDEYPVISVHLWVVYIDGGWLFPPMMFDSHCCWEGHFPLLFCIERSICHCLGAVGDSLPPCHFLDLTSGWCWRDLKT